VRLDEDGMSYSTIYDIEVLDPKTRADARAAFDLQREEGSRALPADLDEHYKPAYAAQLRARYAQHGLVHKGIWGDFDWVDGGGGDGTWHEFKEGLRTISEAYPAFLFVVTTHGEEQPDHHRYWFFRGAMQGGEAKVVYPELDAKQLGLP
jgi:hypothetical protein